ncbi:type II toxin-antitoxin system RelE/ParE family toxin [Phragmitibacter flavus]|uniref:Type II toxin-antitoxin system RelE/ParE family toxin n=1 Tax=Phragmitibacter flavus TaxID=2576071 RepID=A0A5R8K9K3_9BACT|nr:type II toxin-antitoxin system RelE/ParE family toxin [Phragmitibacter flavus]TLD68980.1 type II toxin-antitoxin system RelE/ParE family toxin [Phragmitibacter flavus]
MPPEVIWTRGAEADLMAIYQEIEEFRSGTGHQFLILLDSALHLLRQFPEIAPSFDPPIRRLLLNTRKHGLFYTTERRGIIIHALADLRADPSLLKARLKNTRRN